MYVDASAIVAIIAGESDAESLGDALKASATERLTCAVGVYEATTAVARVLQCGLPRAKQLVLGLLRATETRIVPVDATHGDLALDALARFGKGFHPAKLNMGDCFAYAVAARAMVPILFKGNDFSQTDLPAVTLPA